jgi:hypothetical protein
MFLNNSVSFEIAKLKSALMPFKKVMQYSHSKYSRLLIWKSCHQIKIIMVFCQIMVVVNHNSFLSNLYTSSRITHHEVLFSLSLERVMYYSPNITWDDTWLEYTAGDKPFADVYKVQGHSNTVYLYLLKLSALNLFLNVIIQISNRNCAPIIKLKRPVIIPKAEKIC